MTARKMQKPIRAWALAPKSCREFEVYLSTMSDSQRIAETHLDRGFVNVEVIEVEVRPVKGKKGDNAPIIRNAIAAAKKRKGAA